LTKFVMKCDWCMVYSAKGAYCCCGFRCR